MNNIEMSDILKLAQKNRYEATCGMFHLMDHLFLLDVSSSFKKRKLPIQAMAFIQNGTIKYDYDKVAQNKKAAEEEASVTSKDDSLNKDIDE